MVQTRSASSAFARPRRGRACLCACLLAASSFGALPAWSLSAIAQQPAAQARGTSALRGQVLDAQGKPLPAAMVRLKTSDSAIAAETVTDDLGAFAFPKLATGSYSISAEKAGRPTFTTSVDVSPNPQSIVLRLTPSATTAPAQNQAIEFSDKPNFTVAGVTDWTAVGGHGSDATLRTSEDLARATSTLKPQALPETGNSDQTETRLRAALLKTPTSYAANHELGEYYLHAARYQQALPLLQSASALDHPSASSTHHAQALDEYDLALACQGLGDLQQSRQHIARALAQEDMADAHRLAGELDEKLGDPLAAVKQEERAAQLDPSEENYFAWGSELLLHRAVWQAAEVFKSGAKAHSGSARMLTAWGTALFAGALYDEAALRLCAASDLAPADPEPYLFMGRIELAAPAPLPCVEQKLARFLKAQPDNPTANYLYAMAIDKRAEQPDRDRVETLLTKAATLDPAYADAWLQLGILAFAQRHYPQSIDDYTRAIAADPKQAEAHYRLGVAYDRTGDSAKARREFQLHDELDKAQAEQVEQQRREVKQFLVVLEGQPAYSTHK